MGYLSGLPALAVGGAFFVAFWMTGNDTWAMWGTVMLFIALIVGVAFGIRR